MSCASDFWGVLRHNPVRPTLQRVAFPCRIAASPAGEPGVVCQRFLGPLSAPPSPDPAETYLTPQRGRGWELRRGFDRGGRPQFQAPTAQQLVSAGSLRDPPCPLSGPDCPAPATDRVAVSIHPTHEVALLREELRAAGWAPRHLITDRGKQFTARAFRRGCRRAGVRQRFGAIGKHGSISLVERCIRTLKDEGVRRWLAPIRWRTVGRELSLFADRHNGQRPPAGLAGATPDEIYFGRLPAHHRPRYEPRPRWPRDACCARPQAPVRGRPGVRLAFEVRHLEGRAHLPSSR